MRTPLTAEEIATWLAGHPLWTGNELGLERRTELPSFPAAIASVVAVGDAAEELDHHPDIDLRWRTVTFRLVTHSAGDRVTARDLELADRIDAALSVR